MKQAIIWIHADCLNPQQAALRDNQDSPALFIWDDALLRRREISLKRIKFIYECLLELPVTIRRGHVAEELISFAQEQGASEIITMRSISPGFERIVRTLRQNGLKVTTIVPLPFVELPEEPDLRRFSRYWRVAQPRLAELSSTYTKNRSTPMKEN